MCFGQQTLHNRKTLQSKIRSYGMEAEKYFKLFYVQFQFYPPLNSLSTPWHIVLINLAQPAWIPKPIYSAISYGCGHSRVYIVQVIVIVDDVKFHCTLWSEEASMCFTVHFVHCTLCSSVFCVHCTLCFTIHCLHRTLCFTVHCVHCTLCFTVHYIHGTLCFAVHCVPCTLYCTLCTLCFPVH